MHRRSIAVTRYAMTAVNSRRQTEAALEGSAHRGFRLIADLKGHFRQSRIARSQPKCGPIQSPPAHVAHRWLADVRTAAWSRRIAPTTVVSLDLAVADATQK